MSIFNSAYLLNWQSSIYVANIDFCDPPVSDEGTLEWIAFENIPNIPTPPTDFVIYQYLMRRQAFAFNAIYDENMQLLQMTEEIEGRKII